MARDSGITGMVGGSPRHEIAMLFWWKEPRSAKDSTWVQFIAENPIDTSLATAHVRYGTHGQHTMENTHPFRRVMGCSTHLFAVMWRYERGVPEDGHPSASGPRFENGSHELLGKFFGGVLIVGGADLYS